MATPWDRAAPGYLETWVPRFIPYHVALIHELALKPGERALVVSAGPGAEAVAAARAVDLEGFVRATDKSEEMVRLCREQMQLAGFDSPRRVRCEVAEAADTAGGPWDAVVCAFGLWQLDGEPPSDGHGPSPRAAALTAWRHSLSPSGKIGMLLWGPAEPDDPFERLTQLLAQAEPKHAPARRPLPDSREALGELLLEAGLAIVRHTVIRHPIIFSSNEAFVRAARESCVLRRVWEEIGDVRMEKVATAFYAESGGPQAPVAYSPPATMVIAARPGAEIALAERPSVRVPAG